MGADDDDWGGETPKALGAIRKNLEILDDDDDDVRGSIDPGVEEGMHARD